MKIFIFFTALPLLCFSLLLIIFCLGDVVWCEWNIEVPHYYCVSVDFPLYGLLVFALCIDMLLCCVEMYLQLLYLLEFIPDNYLVSFLVSCKSLFCNVLFFVDLRLRKFKWLGQVSQLGKGGARIWFVCLTWEMIWLSSLGSSCLEE